MHIAVQPDAMNPLAEEFVRNEAYRSWQLAIWLNELEIDRNDITEASPRCRVLVTWRTCFVRKTFKNQPALEYPAAVRSKK
jgi:hypothetical protein